MSFTRDGYSVEVEAEDDRMSKLTHTLAEAQERHHVKVRLVTRPARDLVAELSMPLFHPPPDVLLWGIRVFVADDATADAELVLTYIEAFAYALPLRAGEP